MGRTCGNCHYCVENGLDLVCVNKDSEYVSDFVKPYQVCDEWDGYDEDE